MSQDVFQARMDKILHQVGNGVIGIADDIVVYGKSIEEHDQVLHKMMMMIARKEGLVLRAEKCHIRQKSVNFFGLTWSSKGMQPDEKKCDNIASKPSPKNTEELHSFLGLIQYEPIHPSLGIPNTATAPTTQERNPLGVDRRAREGVHRDEREHQEKHATPILCSINPSTARSGCIDAWTKSTTGTGWTKDA